MHNEWESAHDGRHCNTKKPLTYIPYFAVVNPLTKSFIFWYWISVVCVYLENNQNAFTFALIYAFHRLLVFAKLHSRTRITIVYLHKHDICYMSFLGYWIMLGLATKVSEFQYNLSMHL